MEGLNFRSRNFFSTLLASVGSFGLEHLKVKIAEHAVAAELKAIYIENGPPLLVLQSDQGSELKAAVERLGRKLRVKMVYSRSYHSQSQGKLESYYVRALHVPRWSMIL